MKSGEQLILVVKLTFNNGACIYQTVFDTTHSDENEYIKHYLIGCAISAFWTTQIWVLWATFSFCGFPVQYGTHYLKGFSKNIHLLWNIYVFVSYYQW